MVASGITRTLLGLVAGLSAVATACAGDPPTPPSTTSTPPGTTGAPTPDRTAEWISTPANMASVLRELEDEDRAEARFTGPLGPFEVGQDRLRYRVEAYFPCEPGYDTEFEAHEIRDSELNFETAGPILVQNVCADGTVRRVRGSEGNRRYFVQTAPFVLADAPASRLELLDFEGYPAVLESSVFESAERWGAFGTWRLWILERFPGDDLPGVLIDVEGSSRAEAEANARAILEGR